MLPEDLPEDTATPSAGTLAGLDSDRWAALLPHVRAALHTLEGPEVTPAVARLRAAPTSRLVGGRSRAELCRLLAGGGSPWRAVVERVRGLDAVPDALRWVLQPAPQDLAEEPEADERTVGDTGRERASPDGSPPAALETVRRDLDRVRARLRDAREQRDTWRRRAEGAEVRAAQLAHEAEELERRLAAAHEDVASTRRELDAATELRERAVERERRRRDGELETLRRELSSLRRADEDRRVAARRRLEARELAEREAAEAARERQRPVDEQRTPKLVPGRPSRLPHGVAPQTTEAADALLHAGRLVLIDGYNVTLQHRDHLDLETQRTWLVQRCSTLATRRGIRPVVVFDGERAGGGRPSGGLRGVEVRFTGQGVTADDEVVFAVEATDEPVVVVTDDRELRDRVSASGADVIGTRSFLGAAS